VRRRLALVAGTGALLVAACGAAGGARPPVVTLRAPVPTSLVAGQRWIVRLRARGARVGVVRATSGGHIVTARARRAGGSAYVAELTLPAAGTWRVVARTGRIGRPLARVRVLTSYPLAAPAQALAVDGALLVVERLGRDRILRVDLGTGRTTVASRAVPSPWGLARAADGGTLVSGASGIYALDASGSARRIIAVEASPIAGGDGDEIFFANRDEVGRVRAGAVTMLTTDVAAPHGLFVSGNDVVVSDSGHRRLLRVDHASGAARVIASGLDQPLGAIDAGAGDALVVEFGAGRLVRVGRERTRTTVTDALRKPYALTRGSDGAAYIVEGGEDARPSGGLARVAEDGTVIRLRLVPAWPAT
jgi:hypothetical protein